MSLAGRITIPNSWLKACTNIQSTGNINIPFYSLMRALSKQKVFTKFFSPDKITSNMQCHLLHAALPYSEAHQALLPTITVSPALRLYVIPSPSGNGSSGIQTRLLVT